MNVTPLRFTREARPIQPWYGYCFIDEAKWDGMSWGNLKGTVFDNTALDKIPYPPDRNEVVIKQQVTDIGKTGLAQAVMASSADVAGIAPTMVLLFILGVGYLLNAGFEQQLLLGKPQTRTYYEVLDTYAYKYGIQLGRYSYATAVGLFKSVIGLALVVLANRLSTRLFDLSII